MALPTTVAAPPPTFSLHQQIVAAAPAIHQVAVGRLLETIRPLLDEINQRSGLQLTLATAFYLPASYPKLLYKAGSKPLTVTDSASETSATTNGYSTTPA
jgi:hypothetical protein